jgi:hypothetical protein
MSYTDVEKWMESAGWDALELNGVLIALAPRLDRLDFHDLRERTFVNTYVNQYARLMPIR